MMPSLADDDHYAMWKSEMSVAFARAIAAACACSTSQPAVDNDSIDIEFTANCSGKYYQSPQLNAQLKATSVPRLEEFDLVYDLKVKNYDDLRKKSQVPRILIVLVLHEEPEKWMKITEQKTTWYRCCYWTSVEGEGDVSNKETVRIRIPRKNMFTPELLRRLMNLIADSTHEGARRAIRDLSQGLEQLSVTEEPYD